MFIHISTYVRSAHRVSTNFEAIWFGYRPFPPLPSPLFSSLCLSLSFQFFEYWMICVSSSQTYNTASEKTYTHREIESDREYIDKNETNNVHSFTSLCLRWMNVYQREEKTRTKRTENKQKYTKIALKNRYTYQNKYKNNTHSFCSHFYYVLLISSLLVIAELIISSSVCVYNVNVSARALTFICETFAPWSPPL